MRENEFGQAVSRQLRSQGAMVYPLWAGTMVPAGWPDKLVWSRIWSGLLELKQRGGGMRAGQLPVLAQLHERQPGRVFVVRHRHLADVDVCSPLDGERVLAECRLDELLFTLKGLEAWQSS